ncbi:MAG TPA: DUF2332 domain-containing protein [Mycobacteriales bacterium]|nr:DUF2332 domain-containing protein [Mycobacteriales bacterium]
MTTRPPETPVERTARLFRQQAEGCAAMGSPLYDVLLRRAADDLLAGGPTAAVLDGHLDDPGPSALALRMMGGVHALVLAQQAPELARFYPSVSPSGDVAGPPEQACEAFLSTLEAHRDRVREWLHGPPQTNEVGRGAALIGGLMHACAEAPLPVRLVEIGASAGLNLRADRFRIDGEVATYGDPSSPVQLGPAWHGTRPPRATLEIVERYGGDLHPVDVSTREGRLLLTAYVWADQGARLQRLRGAFELASALPAEVRRESAEQTLERTSLANDAWTVVWHSVFQQYLSAEDRASLATRIESLGDEATGRRRFGYLTLEPTRRTPDRNDSPQVAGARGYEFLVTLRTWPGGDERVLGTASGHGIPTTWER